MLRLARIIVGTLTLIAAGIAFLFFIRNAHKPHHYPSVSNLRAWCEVFTHTSNALRCFVIIKIHLDKHLFDVSLLKTVVAFISAYTNEAVVTG